jgi:hypothetical protein
MGESLHLNRADDRDLSLLDHCVDEVNSLPLPLPNLPLSPASFRPREGPS